MTTPQHPTHYQTLGLSPTATAEQIRRAYREAIRQVHPDVIAGLKAQAAKLGDTAEHARLEDQIHTAEDRAKTLNTAYQVLSDTARRRAYDQLLQRRARQAPPKPRPTVSPYRGEYPQQRGLIPQDAVAPPAPDPSPRPRHEPAPTHVNRGWQIAITMFLLLMLLGATAYSVAVANSVSPPQGPAPTVISP